MLRGQEGEADPGLVVEYRSTRETSEHLPCLWQLALISLLLFPEVGTSFWAGRGDTVGPPKGSSRLSGNTPVEELDMCPSHGPGVGLGTVLLSQLCYCEGSQAVWQARQSLSCEVFRDWMSKALSNLGADPALTWRLDRDQPELS